MADHLVSLISTASTMEVFQVFHPGLFQVQLHLLVMCNVLDLTSVPSDVCGDFCSLLFSGHPFHSEMLLDRGVQKVPVPQNSFRTQNSSPREVKLLRGRKQVGMRHLQTCLRLRRGFKFGREGGKSHQLTGLWHLPN